VALDGEQLSELASRLVEVPGPIQVVKIVVCHSPRANGASGFTTIFTTPQTVLGLIAAAPNSLGPKAGLGVDTRVHDVPF
jgi:hypothetical protein